MFNHSTPFDIMKCTQKLITCENLYLFLYCQLYPLLENRSIATVKYDCYKVIFVEIPSNSNNVTLAKSGCK
jgi:hypothetical protein